MIYLTLIITYHKNLFGTYFVALITLIAVAITFSNKSYTTKIFNHKIFAFLGKFGFIMYLNNTYVRFYVQNLKPEWTYQNKFILFMALIIIISIISYILVDVLPKQLKKYKENQKQKAIKITKGKEKAQKKTKTQEKTTSKTNNSKEKTKKQK